MIWLIVLEYMLVFILTVLYSALTAGLAHFLTFCMSKGNIFRKYKAFITYWFHFKPRPHYGRWNMSDAMIGKIWSKSKYGERFPLYTKHKEAWYGWFYKPLGGCLYCFGTWLYMFFYIALCFLLPIHVSIGIVAGLLGLGSNYLFIDYIEKRL